MRKWKIRDKEYWEAYRYIERKIKNDYLNFFDHMDYETKTKALQEFESIAITEDLEKLQEWVETYMSKEQIERLKTKLKVERSRKKRELKNITLNADTERKLSMFANRYNVTLSEAVEMLLKMVEE